jgi:cytochrome c biogenesis protein CcdA/thiol-disulfide isomerase/thioredoxin
VASRRRFGGTGLRRATVVVLGTLTALALLLPTARATDGVTLLYFGADGCPYCQQMEVFLDELEGRHPEGLVVERREVSGDPAARQRWRAELATRGEQPTGVPTAILGEQVWVGFDQGVAEQIERTVDAALEAAAPIGPPVPDGPEDAEVTDPPDPVEVPLLGPVRLEGRSPLAATALIAFVDGFNPCSLWVLTVLLAMVLNAGATRARMAAVGGTFLLVTGLLYGAFILGAFTVLGFVGYLEGIRYAVAVLALVVGAINVKDYVAFRRGPSLTIPDRFKPRLYRSVRDIRDPRRGLPAVLGLTVLMAAGISLVELPCTAGFPIIWSGILRTQGVAGAEFAGLLALYLLIYVLDELAVFAVALTTLRVTGLQEGHGRGLKLLGGTVMLALAVVLIAAPGLMETLAGALLVMVVAAALALVVAAAHRWRTRGEAVPAGER